MFSNYNFEKRRDKINNLIKINNIENDTYFMKHGISDILDITNDINVDIYENREMLKSIKYYIERIAFYAAISVVYALWKIICKK